MRRRLAQIIALTILVPQTTSAQESLSDLLTDLFVFGTCGEALCLDLSADDRHGRHFIPDLVTGNSTTLLFVSQAVAAAASNLPLSAATVPAEQLGEGSSPGPIFGERAETLGRGQVFVGVNVTGLHMTNLSGVPTSNLAFTFTHEDSDSPTDTLGNPEFEADLLEVRLALDMDIIATSLQVAVGLTERLSFGLYLPVVRTTVRGSSEAQIVPADPNDVRHSFDSLSNVLRTAKEVVGSATGLGDIAARVKLNLTGRRTVSAALLGEVRFATGDPNELLGAGNESARLLAVVSGRWADFSPHLNFGYLFRTGDRDNDAILATAGFDNRLGALTLAVDLITSWQIGRSKIELPEAITFESPVSRVVQATTIPDRRANLIDVSLGFKVAIGTNSSFYANAIIPTRASGFQPDLIWTGGLETKFFP